MPATGDTEALRSRFIAETIAVVDTNGTYIAAHEAVRKWLNSLLPFSKWNDFQCDGEIVLPKPYRILIEPSILYGYYLAWLRRYGAL